MIFDTIIRRAMIVDGTGESIRQGDVGIREKSIAAIGDLSKESALQDIDAGGLYLSPGFVDVHTHDDINVIQQPDMLPKISQGVTTVIVGNCGISAAPARLLDEPPDPMNLLGEQADFQYPRFADYATAVEAAAPRVNVAALVGHISLRNNCMSSLDRAATDSELQNMQTQLAQALSEGAIGLSSGLAYASAREAPSGELEALMPVLAKYSAVYTTHLRDEFDAVVEAMEEAFATAGTEKIPLIISHLKCAGANNWGRSGELLAALDGAAAKQDVACDCYPYSASSSTLDLGQVDEDVDILITWSAPHPEQSKKLLAEIAAEWQLSLLDTAKKLQPAGAVYHCMHEHDVQNILKHDRSMVGSDGLPNDPHPHPRLWGAFPRVLGHYSRDLGLFSLPKAIHKMTGLSATQYRLKKRGFIKEGYFADLVLFDPKNIKDLATFDNPQQPAEGVAKVWVNGSLSYDEKRVVSSPAGIFLYRQAQNYTNQITQKEKLNEY